MTSSPAATAEVFAFIRLPFISPHIFFPIPSTHHPFSLLHFLGCHCSTAFIHSSFILLTSLPTRFYINIFTLSTINHYHYPCHATCNTHKIRLKLFIASNPAMPNLPKDPHHICFNITDRGTVSIGLFTRTSNPYATVRCAYVRSGSTIRRVRPPRWESVSCPVRLGVLVRSYRYNKSPA